MPLGDVKGQRKRIRIEKIVSPRVVQEVHSIIVFWFISYLRVILLMRHNLVTGETFSVVLFDFSTFLLC